MDSSSWFDLEFDVAMAAFVFCVVLGLRARTKHGHVLLWTRGDWAGQGLSECASVERARVRKRTIRFDPSVCIKLILMLYICRSMLLRCVINGCCSPRIYYNAQNAIRKASFPAKYPVGAPSTTSTSLITSIDIHLGIALMHAPLCHSVKTIALSVLRVVFLFIRTEPPV